MADSRQFARFAAGLALVAAPISWASLVLGLAAAGWDGEALGDAAAILALGPAAAPQLRLSYACSMIGSLDSQRAQAVLDTLLRGVASTRARVAILDITGVPVVDTQIANVLIQAARSVQLLGAQVILTGIRPEVAQTMVGLGVEMRGLVTRSDLQSGIAYALRQE